MVEKQDPDNFTCFFTREECTWKLAAYVFKLALNFGLEWQHEIRCGMVAVGVCSRGGGGKYQHIRLISAYYFWSKGKY